MNKPGDRPAKQGVWKSLLEAGLVDIAPDEFPERIREAKRVVIEWLSKLEPETEVQERHSAAHSLGTLKKLETTLRAKTSAPTSTDDR